MVTVGYGCHGWFWMAGGGYGVLTGGWSWVVMGGYEVVTGVYDWW